MKLNQNLLILLFLSETIVVPAGCHSNVISVALSVGRPPNQCRKGEEKITAENQFRKPVSILLSNYFYPT